jgi:hypothetical protein
MKVKALTLPITAVLVIMFGSLSMKASAVGTDTAPGQQPPANTTGPSINGTAVDGQTLTAERGDWSGPSVEYGYQWQRCDASGDSCSSVAGAGDSTYGLVSSDVGSTLRTVVTATNKNGSVSVASAATDVVAPVPAPAPSVPATTTAAPTTTTGAAVTTPTTTQATTTTAPTTTTTAEDPYFNGDLSTGDLSQWQDTFGMNLSATPPGVSVVATPAGYAAKVLVDPSVTGGSSSGPSTTMWEGNGTNTFKLPWQQSGSDTWFHARYLFPNGTDSSYPGEFTPMPQAGWGADWDVLMEWHSAPGAGYSTYIGIWNGSSAPYLLLRTVGQGGWYSFIETDQAQTKACSSAQPCGTPQPMKYNHWYDIVVHVKYSTDPTVGHIQWYLDGRLLVDDYLSTLNAATDGSVPGVAFENGLYRNSGGSSQVDTTYIQGIKVGPTRVSVGG